jgi:hypothetical protein
LLAGVASAAPEGAANVPQIQLGFTQRPFSLQRTFLTTESITFEATYYDPASACTGMLPVLTQLLIFNPQGLLVAQFTASPTASPFGPKYQLLTTTFAAGLLGPGTFVFTFLVRDCTDTRSIVLLEAPTFTVFNP